MTNGINYIQISQQLLYAVRTGDSSENFILQLSAADKNELKKQLSTDAEKKAFWLNIYNAFIQKLLSEHPEKYKSRNSFFTNKQIEIAGIRLSPDDIEHGMLRRSKAKWSMGYFNKLFPSRFEKDFRVSTLDNRIHFALNCGAKSCPPIAYYSPENIDRELELATKNYLHTESDLDRASGVIYLPKIMSWFRADFGGKKGMKKMLEKYGVTKKGEDITIRFKKYDWTLFLNNYRQEN
ncbi:MAG: DUF547 domain-containing protein [Bacteroidota bacterium]|nr:DUF547 domain-containing protein [Bacteroidota bacterium]